MTNTLVPAEAIDYAVGCVQSSVSLRRSYSGRGMYGSTCFGVVFEEPRGAFEFFAGLAQYAAEQQEFPEPDCDSELAFDLARSASQDSMGYSTIVYFPRFEVEGRSAFDDEDVDEDY
jgi:hypothetical protein